MIKIPRIELDVIIALNEQHADYLIIGGYAVRFHGRHRAVNDLDILSSPLDGNPERVFPVLKAMIPGTPRFTAANLQEYKKQLIFKDSGRNLDILTSIDGVDIGEALRDRIVVELEGAVLPFISKHHLVAHLRAISKIPDRVAKASRDIECLVASAT